MSKVSLRIRGGKPLTGSVTAPADKSMLHRALMLSAVASGEALIEAQDPGADTLSTAAVLRQLGVGIDRVEQGFRVTSNGVANWQAPKNALNCGNSGTTMRLMAGLLAGAGIDAELMGDDSLSVRPMGRVCAPLREMGAAIQGADREGRELPPLRVSTGAFQGGLYRSPIASAQVKSAMLLAGVASGRAVQVVEPAVSRDHSERMLNGRGAAVNSGPADGSATQGEGHLVSLEAGAQLTTCDMRVPGDVSSAAFLVAAGLIVPGSKVSVTGVGVNATRTGMLEILEELGANVRVTGWREDGGEPTGDLTAEYGELNAVQAGELPTFVVGEMIPRLVDELPVLAAVAAHASGVFEVREAAELRVKESDRIAETVRLLAAFGISAEERSDGFSLRGPQPPQAATVDVGHDHRLAMTAAVLALSATGESVLRGFEVADVSFPGFAQLLRRLGADLELC